MTALGLPLFADAPVPTPTQAPATPGTAPGATAPATTPTPSPTPVPTMPSSFKLTNGAVLHNVTVVRWLKESVTVRHTGGADTIYYSNIAEPDRTTVLAARDEALKHQKSDPSSKPAENSVRGSISVTTDDGAEVPLTGVTVYAVTADAINLFSVEGRNVKLPKALASTTTDGDGQFSITVPGHQEYFIFAKASKLVGQSWGYYEWRLLVSQIGDRQNVQLTGASSVPREEQKFVSFDNK
jgi:hypothetical protein